MQKKIAAILFSTRLDQILQPISSEPLAAFEQMLGRSLFAAIFTTVIYTL